MSVVPAPTRLSGEGGGGDAPASSPGGAPTAAITASSTPALTPSSDAALEEIMRLVALLPPPVAAALASRPDCADVLEVVMDVGRPPLARYPSGDVRLSPSPITPADLEGACTRLGEFGDDNRAGIDATLHRVSALRSRAGKVVGLTARVGRAVPGSAAAASDLALAGASILLLGKPGVGKTTAIRELARLLAADPEGGRAGGEGGGGGGGGGGGRLLPGAALASTNTGGGAGRRVVIVDSSNEVAGDGDVPHPALGRARRLMVADRAAQHGVMVEAVENHMPEVVVIDEIGTAAEAAAARTIAQRGVQLVATAHGGSLASLIANPALADLVGGIEAVTLGDDEARRRGGGPGPGGRKTVLERSAPPTFDACVEMLDLAVWRVHPDLAAAVDAHLRGGPPPPGGQVRVRGPDGVWVALPPDADPADVLAARAGTGIGGTPFTSVADAEAAAEAYAASAAASARAAGIAAFPATAPGPGLQARGAAAGASSSPASPPPLRIFVFGLPDADVASAAAGAGLEGLLALAPRLGAADVVLALRSAVRGSPRVQADAREAGVPVYAVKAGSARGLTRALRALVGLDPVAGGGLFGGGGGGEGADGADAGWSRRGDAAPGPASASSAAADARAAVASIVLPSGLAAELAPAASAAALGAQVAAAAEFGLVAEVVGGGGPGARVRILPPGVVGSGEEVR